MPLQFLLCTLLLFLFYSNTVTAASDAYSSMMMRGATSEKTAKQTHSVESIHTSSENPYPARWNKSKFYLGAITGYGSTDWGMLVINCDPKDIQCDATMRDILAESAPKAAGDDGAVWGVTAGYEVNPTWAMEASYIRFPTTLIHIKPNSFFYNTAFPNDIAANFSTETWGFIFVGKFMTQIGHSGIRGFANAGLDVTHRKDIYTNASKISATFGAGLNYVFKSDVMLELFFQYIAGYGQSNEIPIVYYMPFLYTVGIKMMYRI